VNPGNNRLALRRWTVALPVTVSLAVLIPALTFVLFALKGIPSFAAGHLREILVWIYQVSWVPALFSGAATSAIVLAIIARTGFFHRPYDAGRCISLGAVTGAVTEGLATWLYRKAYPRPFSWFWISSATIAGCLGGALVVALVLWRISRDERRR
jgi:hypothetical protein